MKFGFTLVELLVTIAIVGVLAAISIAVFQEYKYQANFASVRIVQKHLHTALMAWSATEWDEVTGQMNRWIHNADGTDVYTGDGAEFREFYPEPIPSSGIFFNGRIDTRCWIGMAGCGTNSPIGQNVGHCDTSSTSNARAWGYFKYTDGTIYNSEQSIAKSTYNCPS